MQCATLASMTSAFAAAIVLCGTNPAHAVGQRVDVQVVDRNTGEVLTTILHDGQWWIAGRPGGRYGITLLNRNGRRILNVVSVDGVNAISGDTAAWHQTGYVLDPYQRTEVDGWRKNLDQVAAFEFTALPDSYAARTGRPANVGVIGIAMFDERPRPAAIVRPRLGPDSLRQSAPLLPSPASSAPPGDDASDAPLREPVPRAEAERSANAAKQPDRLGTGHGAIEASSIRYVAFQRAQSEPNEIVTIHYDRIENLIAMGILPAHHASPVAVDPFPNSSRFVPDPPARP